MPETSISDNLSAEAILDPAIQFLPSPSLKNPSNALFLTGASGFLGGYLLAELLNKTSAQLYCLVRADNIAAAQKRLQQNLVNYGLWKDEWQQRIITVVGDLSKPLLNLSKADFEQLADTIDVIYHNGAHINAFHSYKRLKASNVLGTQEVLRLAGLKRTKPVHFVSSMAVFFSQSSLQSSLIKETDDPIADGTLKGGYKQSKWVAEALIRVAQQRGLPACIYRPVRILGHSQTGINGNMSDALCNLLKACIELGTYPLLDARINLVPVDYVSESIVHLSQQPESLGKAFHLFNPKSIEWNDLLTLTQSLGYSLKALEYEQWQQQLQTALNDNPKNRAYTFLSLFFRSPNALMMKKPPLDALQTLEGLQNSTISCPLVDQKLLTAYFNYFKEINFLAKTE
ncbi:MAG: thioester reductase domain-containing protein [Methylococcales bacterium]|nr:thioester reductase domain-containing protein [Methylococcales bacterium]